MRILLLAQFYQPIMGGVERHVQSLAEGLTERGHDVSVVTLWHAGLNEFELNGKIRIYRVRGSMQRLNGLFTVDRQHSPPFPDPEVTTAIHRIIEKEHPDIVHAHNWIVHSFLPIKRWSKAKLILTLHDCELSCVQMRMMYYDKVLCSGPEVMKCIRCASHHYGKLKGMVTLSGNWLMSIFERNLVDMFIPVSQAIAEANGLIKLRVPYKVIPNFVPDNITEVEQDDLDPRVAALPQEFILQVGDLAIDKGIEVLLEAYQKLSSPPPLVLIGRKLPESPKLLPPNVILIDSLPHKAVMQAWNQCIFGTIPSTCLDASPTVTLEAMASGKPVVASRIGGIPDQVIDGETGFLFPAGDALLLKEKMEKLIKDKNLRINMGLAAKKRVADFQANSVIGKLEDIYREQLNS